MPSTNTNVNKQPATGLWSKSFLGLLLTQFLGAVNDNMVRWLVVKIVQPVVGTAETLSLGLAFFTLPYLLFATAAGYFADRFSKRTVIVVCKVAEVVIMGVAVAGMIQGSVTLLFAAVALMGCQSALFSPSKMGSIPEMIDGRLLSKANGLMGLVTVVASAAGGVAGYALFSRVGSVIQYSEVADGVRSSIVAAPTFAQVTPVMGVLLGVAVAGLLTSLLIRRLPVANPQREPTLNPITDTWPNLRLLASDKPLFRCALGIAFFWLLASLAQMNIDPFGAEILGLSGAAVGSLLGILVLGVGLGSVLAGIWSGGTVELGIVPLGATGITISAFLLFLAGDGVDVNVAATQQQAYFWSCVFLFSLGASAGLFNIPLVAYLQDRSHVRNRGTILAASNFITFSFILAASLLFYVMTTVAGMSSAQVFLAASLGTIPIIVYVVWLLPQATVRFAVWILSWFIYRIKIVGRDKIPRTGGGLIVCNHVSWLDGAMLLLASSRTIRMIAWADYIQHPAVKWLTSLYDVIPIRNTDGPREIMRSLKEARKAIENGELVCIFAEGTITRTGQIQPFQRGMLRILHRLDAPVIPAYLDGLWGSIFSWRGGKLLWKKPRQWPYPVTVLFGDPLEGVNDVPPVQRAVERLGAEAVTIRKGRNMVPPRRFLRMCRRARSRIKTADSTGAELSGGKLLTAVLAMRRVIAREIGSDEKMVGLWLPPSVGGVVANVAVTLLKRAAVNLNYTLSDKDVDFCVKQAGIKHVLTSRKFLDKKPFNADAELICLEDLREKITGVDKAIAAAQAYATPVAVLERMLGLTSIKPDDLMTVIFTSGSTGEPKGVMLSHNNVASNIDAIDELFHIDSNDALLGVLPYFHSFGFTGTLWLCLCLEPKAVYHFNPLDGRTVGNLSEKHGVSILMATPTFLRTYIKRCTPEQFHKMNLVVVGAEKLPPDLSKQFEDKFGFHPTEGYGTTELSPVAAVNVPATRSGSEAQSAEKAGTVGRALSGVAVKTINVDTGEDVEPGGEGLLLINGPNVMLGYLGQPEKTAEVLKDGWYNTGDVARIDEEGFIEITGRQSRFSKIGGEMVPHIMVEQHLKAILEDPEAEEAVEVVAVTSVPCPKKGERLIVLHRRLDRPVDEILKQLAESEMPNLWLPSADSFAEVEEIPVLGTGKLDLKAVKQTALDRFGSGAADG